MEPIFITGLILFLGFVFGEAAERFKLPRITGYILAGLALNPGLFHIIPKNFVDHTGIVSNIALAFITFSVGGTLLFPRVRNLGKSILYITLFEGSSAFIMISLGFLVLSPFLMKGNQAGWLSLFLPFSILIGSLGSPTDPSATIAVSHEYKAKGEVSTTIMGVAAMDDVLGILIYCLAVAAARMFVSGRSFQFLSFIDPLREIGGAVFLGMVFGFLFNKITRIAARETEGVLIVLIIGLLSLCFGTASRLKVDELLSTMTMGIIVVNYNDFKEKIFRMMERYTEELIFVLFFTISAMHLKFSVLRSSYLIVLAFVIFRITGKILGSRLGAQIAHSPDNVKKYTAGGLIPQGGIVIGLALLIKQNSIFSGFSDIIINVIIGATIIHELIGPVFAKAALQKAGEISKNP
jgi:Kef-type K+ transport system membrane component KefB